MIMLERNELMSSRKSGSEKALAELAIERLGKRPGLRLLIGGYGMGFTLRAALAALGRDAQVMVAELVPEIIEWARGPMAALTGDCLDDPRVEIRIGDVAAVIAEGQKYDAILLDVDNGPDAVVRPDNDGLYARPGLRKARAALNPGGILAIWSASSDPVFANRLAKAEFVVDEVKLRARENGKGPIHYIWFATRR
jgi:spermidine synthase